jgi:hypothetical protein
MCVLDAPRWMELVQMCKGKKIKLILRQWEATE